MQFTSSASAQTETLENLLKVNSYVLENSNGTLSGKGMDFLMQASADAQFFVVAEPHNSKEVPEITGSLFKPLHQRHRFNYLALEQDPVMAQIVSDSSSFGNAAFVSSLAKKYPNAFTFITDQEIEMISQARTVSNGKANRIWGLDQVFGAIHVLDRLSKFAPNADVRSRTLKLIEVLKQNEAEYSKKFERYTMAKIGEIAEFQNLLREYQPKKNSEAEFIISQTLLSGRIYKNNILADKELTGYLSNYEREENMKSLFMREYRKAQAAGEKLPKVLLKLGHNHTIRGLNWTNLPTLGNFVSEFAKSNDMNSFNLAVYVNNAAGDYGVLSSNPDLKTLAEAAPKDKWTVIDLRQIRKYVSAGKSTGTNTEMKRIIFGFDAILVIGGGSRGTYKTVIG
ncbi:MAG TPA: hypothetical protein VF692_08535 [Pyrinomonadaceae bacterium]